MSESSPERDASDSRKRHDDAFTLIELTIVIAIIALIVAGATMGVRALARTDLRSAAVKVSGSMRFAFDRATTTGRHYRLAVDFTGGDVHLEMSENPYVMLREEAARKPGDTSEEDQTKPLETLRPQTSIGGFDLASLPQRPPADFQAFTESRMKPVALGRITVKSIWTPRYAEPRTEGKAFLYYFPQGFAEEAVVVLSHGDAAYSLLQHPLTGKVKVLAYEYQVARDQGTRDDLGERVE